MGYYEDKCNAFLCIMPEQHPIPQQISSFSFKLVGDMTLKQFSQLAAGILISLVLYASPLHPFIKWPLIMFSFLFGIALAFLPIQGRPLSTWLLIFFKGCADVYCSRYHRRYCGNPDSYIYTNTHSP